MLSGINCTVLDKSELNNFVECTVTVENQEKERPINDNKKVLKRLLLTHIKQESTSKHGGKTM